MRQVFKAYIHMAEFRDVKRWFKMKIFKWYCCLFTWLRFEVKILGLSYSKQRQRWHLKHSKELNDLDSFAFKEKGLARLPYGFEINMKKRKNKKNQKKSPLPDIWGLYLHLQLRPITKTRWWCELNSRNKWKIFGFRTVNVFQVLQGWGERR